MRKTISNTHHAQALRAAIKSGHVQQIAGSMEGATERARIRYHYPDGTVEQVAYTTRWPYPTTQPLKPGVPVIDFPANFKNL